MSARRTGGRQSSRPPSSLPVHTMDDLAPDELLAQQLVDEALQTMAIPPSLRRAIRASMIGELLATAEGRRQLRRVAPDPTVASSGDVAKPGAPAKKKAANGGDGGAAKRSRRGGGRS